MRDRVNAVRARPSRRSAGLRAPYAWLLLALGALACGSGEYGHARLYTPLSGERQAAMHAKAYDAVAMQRDPRVWQGKPISVFGVVKSRNSGPDGAAYLTLSVRKLAKHNWCKTKDPDSCRVTVGKQELGVVHALAKLSSGDDIGKHSVQPDSLLRVIGVLGDTVDPNDGMPVLHATYYRHWPQGQYVARSARTAQ